MSTQYPQYPQYPQPPGAQPELPVPEAPAQSAGHLVIDPSVGLFQPDLERDRRGPTQAFDDQRIIAVASAHALRRAEVVTIGGCKLSEARRDKGAIVKC